MTIRCVLCWLLLLAPAWADVKAEFQARWDEMDQAYSQFDVEGYVKYLHPDFTAGSGDQLLTRDQVVERVRQMSTLDKSQGGSHQKQTRVLEVLEQTPDLVRIRTRQGVVGDDSTEAPIDRPPATVDETWVKTEAGWMLKSSRFNNPSTGLQVGILVGSDPPVDPDPPVKPQVPEIVSLDPIKPEMVFIKGGTFEMGGDLEHRDERPVHTVELDSFSLGKYEVTNKEYKRFRPEHKGTWSNSDYPVEQVSWEDAAAYCQWLTHQTGDYYRLPTEAEWEFACRAGSTADCYWGASLNRETRDSPSIGDYGWYLGNSGGTVHPVGQKKPNAWGLYDMAGNVYEACRDHYGEEYYKVSPRQNPTGPRRGTSRVFRGGSWGGDGEYCQSGRRNEVEPDFRDGNSGFRLVLVDDASGIPSSFDPQGGAINAKDGSVLITMGTYEISKYEVTNAQYARFVKATGYDGGSEWREQADKWGPRCPVGAVSYSDAVAYCKWARLRLPTDAEWKGAAQGTDGRTYPWGNEEPNDSHAVWRANSPEDVGSRPAGISPAGCLDMAGNVWEWTELVNVRGGGWTNPHTGDLRAGEAGSTDGSRSSRVSTSGFRCARDRVISNPE